MSTFLIVYTTAVTTAWVGTLLAGIHDHGLIKRQDKMIGDLIVACTAKASVRKAPTSLSTSPRRKKDAAGGKHALDKK